MMNRMTFLLALQLGAALTACGRQEHEQSHDSAQMTNERSGAVAARDDQGMTSTPQAHGGDGAPVVVPPIETEPPPISTEGAPKPEPVVPEPGSAHAALPDSVKGYELYAWDEKDRMWFTLTTGTNRRKSATEVTKKVSEIDDNFVHITSQGAEALQLTLMRVPKTTPVIFDQHADLPSLSTSSKAGIDQIMKTLGR